VRTSSACQAMQPTRIKPLAIHESFGILHHRHLRKLYPILEVLNSTTDGNSECNKYSVPKTRTVPGATTASSALPRHPNALMHGSALLSLISLFRLNLLQRRRLCSTLLMFRLARAAPEGVAHVRMVQCCRDILETG
jgi:hypothetical protein